MNYDMCFCANLNCHLRRVCGRFVDRISIRGKVPVLVSVATFAPHPIPGGVCDFFVAVPKNDESEDGK